MSFSFNVRAASVSEASMAVQAKMEEVIAAQPVHSVDQDAVIATTNLYLDIVGEPDAGNELSVSVNGSVAIWDGHLRSASVGVNVGISPLSDPIA